MWKKVVMWVLSVFMLLMGISAFRSLLSIIMIICGIAIMPLNIIDDLFEKINLTGWKRLVLFIVLFLVAFNLTPEMIQKYKENVSTTETVVMESSDKSSTKSMDSTKDVTGSVTDTNKLQDLSDVALTRGSMGDDKEESNIGSSSSESVTSITSTPTATPAITSVGTKGFPEADDPADYEAEKKVTYILNTNSMKFHKPSCNDVKKMSTGNRMDVTWDRNTVINKGYSPCGHCNP